MDTGRDGRGPRGEGGLVAQQCWVPDEALRLRRLFSHQTTKAEAAGL